MRDPQPAHWTVTLDAQYNIYRFRIYNRNERCEEQPCGARLNGFTLSVGNTSQNYKLCYEDTTTSTSGPGAIINGVCNGGPVHGDIVRIMPDTGLPLTLCEVQIFGGWRGQAQLVEFLSPQNYVMRATEIRMRNPHTKSCVKMWRSKHRANVNLERTSGNLRTVGHFPVFCHHTENNRYQLDIPEFDVKHQPPN